ncbi:hypothetical protein CH273_09145 [Rhodococcus sp. 05-339-2]|nr:hypothetical protein CH273_09145 [Rhodococcus sp. 05-339-2]
MTLPPNLGDPLSADDDVYHAPATCKPRATPSTIVVARVVTNPVKDTPSAIAEVTPRMRESGRVVTGKLCQLPRRRCVRRHFDAITLDGRTDNEPTPRRERRPGTDDVPVLTGQPALRVHRVFFEP